MADACPDDNVKSESLAMYRSQHTRAAGLEKLSGLPVLDQFLKLKTDSFLDKKLKNRPIKLCILKILQYTD